MFALRLPLAHVGVMKHDLRLPLTGAADHFCRNIEPFDDKSSFQEQFNEPSTAAAANIESSARAIQELVSDLGDGAVANRDDLRAARKQARPSERRKPYVFKFRSPDRSYSLALQFRQSTVDRTDLIRALENILADLRTAEESS